MSDHKVGHVSMQYSDSRAQWRHDARIIFSRGYEWITGTEAGESDNWAILREMAEKHGYVIRRYKSNWIAVQKKVIKSGTFKTGVKTVVNNDLVAGPGHDTAYLWVQFVHTTSGVGKISVTCSHYPTRGTPVSKNPAKRVNLKWTKKIALAVASKMAALGKGRALSFYGGDQNIVDKYADTFFGGPAISCWDETKNWPNTGHGNIDVIARYKRDFRVKCVRARAFSDRQLFLHTDHFLIEAVYRIQR